MTRNKAPAPETPDPVGRFETDLKVLEEIVSKMEAGDLPLEESLALFERGMALTLACRQALEQAELRVNRLKPDNHEYVERDEPES